MNYQIKNLELTQNINSKYKNSKKLRQIKKSFKKRIKNCNIGNNKELIKLIGIKDTILMKQFINI